MIHPISSARPAIEPKTVKLDPNEGMSSDPILEVAKADVKADENSFDLGAEILSEDKLPEVSKIPLTKPPLALLPPKGSEVPSRSMLDMMKHAFADGKRFIPNQHHRLSTDREIDGLKAIHELETQNELIRSTFDALSQTHSEHGSQNLNSLTQSNGVYELVRSDAAKSVSKIF